MSTPTDERDTLLDKLAWLTRDYMPDALWTVEGAFRFDRSLFHAARHLATTVAVRKINRVAGAPSCLWSLDWFTQHRPMAPGLFAQLLDAYTRHDIAVTLVFDNPFIREDALNDAYGRHLVSELLRHSTPTAQHAVSVACDKLATHLQALAPALPIHCHINHLLSLPPGEIRSAAFYNRLAERYRRICLHPADAVNPAIYSALDARAQVDIIVNDPCLRTCPARREHLQILADSRQAPYDATHLQRRTALLNHIGCLKTGGTPLQQKKSSTLTKAECRALYEAGYRSFIIQSRQFRNEMPLLWDICQCMFALPPEQSHKQATLNTGLMLSLLPHTTALSSGLADFSSEGYD